eukprot:CAMPEP_0168349718 /NCGR_PEP_ID=MMETSP0213-20121227/20609_1 /TAXON_ID=151035 /ORGANISM="Euplotes harpa, Strain FSP1.4" /LENGTH=44 /DNA_ID= /DNA_START= /DNA_END= /DNA_ORIENTATION=
MSKESADILLAGFADQSFVVNIENCVITSRHDEIVRGSVDFYGK